MPAYNVLNSRGNLVTTINVGTTTGANFPIEMIGQGISLYGGIVSETQYHIMENFANSAEPTNPVEGMFWYDSDTQLPNFRNVSQFVPVTTANSGYAHQFSMLAAATDVDFTVAGSTTIFQAPGLANVTHHPTGVLLLPKSINDGGLPPIGPTQLNLYIDTSEDIMENVLVQNYTMQKHAFYTIQGMTRFASNAEEIKLEITSPATGAGAIDLKYDVIVYGYQSVT